MANNSEGNGDRQLNDQQLTDRWVNERLGPLSPDRACQPNVSRGFARLRERREGLFGRKRRWTWAVVGVVLSGFPLAALPVTRVIAQRCVAACVRESGKLREFLIGAPSGPPPSSTFVKVEDRKAAPDFVVSDASGKPVKLSDFRGKTIVLNFWATWCEPCKVEIPMLKDLQQAYQDRDFTVVGVSLEPEGWSSVKPYMETAQFNYPVMVGGEDIAALYGLEAIPTSLVIDKFGRIAAIHVGLCGRSEYEAEINALLRE
jgi:cytochrome c biogenesis protein CcmG/thiol:disulfide interchange protein DsbE